MCKQPSSVHFTPQYTETLSRGVFINAVQSCTQTFWCGLTSHSSFQVILTNLQIISCHIRFLWLLCIYIGLNALHIKQTQVVIKNTLLRLTSLPGFPTIQFLIAGMDSYGVNKCPLHTISDQKLDGWKAWEWGYSNHQYFRSPSSDWSLNQW